MMQSTKRLDEKENSIQEFTVLFWEDHLIVDGQSISLGQITTEVLNYPDDQLLELRRKLNGLAGFMRGELFHPGIKKDLALVTAAQKKLNGVLNDVMELPLFRLLDLNKDLAQSMLVTAFERYPEDFSRMVTEGTTEYVILAEYLLKLISLPDELLSFKSYTTVLLDLYFDRLKLRNSESYAVGLFDFFSDARLLNEVATSLPSTPFQSFHQSCSVMLEFTTMPHPERKEQYIIAERTVFHRLGEFLQVDFFRGLMHGHAPRRCKNCGRFFLLTEGYNAVYCNRIAPGETMKTCQKVGAHRIAEENEKYKTPERKLYDKVYNRLKTRHYRGKLSSNEWNQTVQLAWEYKEKAERGELQFHELEKIYKEM